MATSKLTKMPPKLDYTSAGLTPIRCTIQDGGYAKFGNLVFINIRFTATGTQPQITGFPIPLQKSTNYIGFCGYDGSNEKPIFGYIETASGKLMIPAAYGSSGTGIVSVFYLAGE